MRLQAWHVIVLIVAFILLFGWKNLPNAARSLGESMRVFKTEVDQMKDDSAARKDHDVAAPSPSERHGAVDDQRHDSSSEKRTGNRYRDTADDEYRKLSDRRGDDVDPRA
ncbi:MAG: Sec-independent protein translocase subunit TatA [Ornithinimicrobium sp.]|uniref:Sec-independent protein translocase subunit TatA n=1 Tax=Ornithinimicrobium sp. TaxID=1977084 RepID=UPI0026DFC68E|nr:Sec-independent protein translocase subunit TatA [Ornithinimicrobium sp.]MDO5738572.1 Sec-independent protein translocase subunit TatA [Ornithinimicrobium sp.]